MGVETAVTPELLRSIYNDMLARAEMGLLDLDDGNSINENMWDAVQEKLPPQFHPQTKGQVSVFGAIFGAVSERLVREHREAQGLEWW
jgi:hypothetical protein